MNKERVDLQHCHMENRRFMTCKEFVEKKGSHGDGRQRDKEKVDLRVHGHMVNFVLIGKLEILKIKGTHLWIYTGCHIF